MAATATDHVGLHDALRALATAGGVMGMHKLAEQLGFDVFTKTWDGYFEWLLDEHDRISKCSSRSSPARPSDAAATGQSASSPTRSDGSSTPGTNAANPSCGPRTPTPSSPERTVKMALYSTLAVIESDQIRYTTPCAGEPHARVDGEGWKRKIRATSV
jgi:hypothetical protein